MRTPNFKEWLGESDDHEGRLRELGLAPKPPADERWDEFVNEWSGDPEVDALYSKLKARTSDLLARFIDDEDRESDEWQQMIEWMGGSGLDDVGILEWMVFNSEI